MKNYLEKLEKLMRKFHLNYRFVVPDFFSTSPDDYKIIARITKDSNKFKRLTPFNLSNLQ